MVDLDEKYLLEIKRILKKLVPECEVRAFGSRTNGTAKKYSDLDIVLMAREKLEAKRLTGLKDAFSESDLPIVVDVLDWHNVTENFREIIKKDWEILQQSIRRHNGLVG
jgi:predicted nucleotidyltransferase